MPTLTPEELRLRETLCKEYRIVFAGEVRPSAWPKRHKTMLEQLHELGNRKYDTYADSPEQADHEPWRAERKSLAEVLTQVAKRFHHRNESSWRHGCEPIILGRLSAEVCWQVNPPEDTLVSPYSYLNYLSRACRKRIWRSDIEVTRDGDTGVATHLRNRQQTRQPCRCPRQSRSQDHLEAVGLNQIFNYRIDDQVNHDPDITQKLKKKERPDRIYGLRQTRNIENLLNDTIKRRNAHERSLDGSQVQEMLGLPLPDQPMNATGDRQLFPFLVLEAKSGSSGDDWHSIQMQTAFSIRTFLETQNRLRAAAGPLSRWQTGPLVWFLSNRGEDWRLCAAYVEDGVHKAHTVGTTDYIVLDVWRGCIVSRDGALQLLLLVDYIFDWARDIYREDIIRELRTLASGENDAASTVGTDVDILSYCQLDPFDHLNEDGSGNDNSESYTEALRSFHTLDSVHGAIRHATFVESRYCCVYITGDNVQTLLRSTQPKIKERLCRLILRELETHKPILLDPQTLGRIEEEWTGTARLSGVLCGVQADLYTVMTCTTYLDAKWQQVRELFAVAMTRDAWSAIVSASGIKQKARIHQLSPPADLARCNRDSALMKIKRLRAGTPQQVLLTAITRRAVRISQRVAATKARMCGTQEDDGAVRALVNFIYTSYKKGTLEPQEPFLRLSKRFDLQHTAQSGVAPVCVSKHHTLQTSADGCVLLTTTCGTASSAERSPNLCVYLTEGDGCAPAVHTLGPIVRRAFETRDVYHTARDHRSASTIHKIAERVRDSDPRAMWNIPSRDFAGSIYGMYSHGAGLLRLVKSLNIKSTNPLTQGASKDPTADGSLLHERCLFPWQDPRVVHRNLWERMFLIYKLLTTDIAYWRGVARERRANGVSCCQCCAAIGDHDTCPACEGVFQNRFREQWYKNALRGEEAIQVRPLQGAKLEARLRAVEKKCPDYPGSHQLFGLDDKDAVWARNLDFYAELNQPFESVGELYKQWRRFKAFCTNNHRWHSLGKRKRSDSP